MATITAAPPPVKSARNSLKNPLSVAAEVEPEPVAEDFGPRGNRRAKPVVRTCRIEGNFPFDGYGILTITVNGVETDYTVESIATDFGGEAFSVVKHVGSALDECPVYHITLTGTGNACDCKGGTYSTARTGKPCKHIAALLALRTAGKI